MVVRPLIPAHHSYELYSCDRGNIYANISEDGTVMTVDFSPKGGPPDAVAQLTPSGHITWTGNNAWERTSYENSFAGEFNSVFSGDALPQFSSDFERVHISVADLSPPDTTLISAVITAPNVWGDTSVPATIRFNQITVNFSVVGGLAGVQANLTESGDILWLESENIWERSLCSAGSTGDLSPSSDGSDKDINLDALAFTGALLLVAVCSAILAVIGVCTYDSRRRKDDILMSNSK